MCSMGRAAKRAAADAAKKQQRRDQEQRDRENRAREDDRRRRERLAEQQRQRDQAARDIANRLPAPAPEETAEAPVAALEISGGTSSSVRRRGRGRRSFRADIAGGGGAGLTIPGNYS